MKEPEVFVPTISSSLIVETTSVVRVSRRRKYCWYYFNRRAIAPSRARIQDPPDGISVGQRKIYLIEEVAIAVDKAMKEDGDEVLKSMEEGE